MTNKSGKLNICMVTSVRNEGVHLLEWIAYHRTIGIQHFLIFSNDCDDGTDELLGKFQQAGMVTHVPQAILPSEKPQQKAFQRAWQEFLPAIKPDYVFVADPDEFLNLKFFDTMNELLDYYDYPDAIAIQWRHFGSSSHYFRERGLTLEKFLYASASDNYNNRLFKTLNKYDPENIKAIVPHRPVFRNPKAARYIFPGICRSGVDVPQDIRQGVNPKFAPDFFPVMHSVAQLNHYAIRSLEEYKIKRNRGNGFLSNAMQATSHYRNDYFEKYNLNDTKETSILRRLPELKAQIQVLVTDLNLDDLRNELEVRFANKLLETTDTRISGNTFLVMPDTLYADPLLHPVLDMESLSIKSSEFTGYLLLPSDHYIARLCLHGLKGQCLDATLERPLQELDSKRYRFKFCDLSEDILWLSAVFSNGSERTLAKIYLNVES